MNDFEQCLNALRDARVDFVVIGGVALAAQGSAYVTYDLDICYDRDPANVSRLVQALGPLHPRLRGVTEEVPFRFDVAAVAGGMNFTLETDLGDLDLFGEVAGLGQYRDVHALSEKLDLFGRPCHVLSVDGLIQAKRAAGRTKDLLVLPELEALREIKPQIKPESTSVRDQDKRISSAHEDPRGHDEG